MSRLFSGSLLQLFHCKREGCNNHSSAPFEGRRFNVDVCYLRKYIVAFSSRDKTLLFVYSSLKHLCLAKSPLPCIPWSLSTSNLVFWVVFLDVTMTIRCRLNATRRRVEWDECTQSKNWEILSGGRLSYSALGDKISSYFMRHARLRFFSAYSEATFLSQ